MKIHGAVSKGVHLLQKDAKRFQHRRYQQIYFASTRGKKEAKHISRPHVEKLQKLQERDRLLRVIPGDERTVLLHSL